MSDNLGALEEIILLIVMTLDEAYGVTVAETYKEKIGNSISVPAVHTVLKRLEKKGFIESAMGDPSPERGGRRKRLYTATKHGYKTLANLQETRSQLWSLVPKIKFI